MWCPVLVHDLDVERLEADRHYYDVYLLDGSWDPLPIYENNICYAEDHTEQFLIVRAPGLSDEQCLGLPQLKQKLRDITGTPAS